MKRAVAGWGIVAILNTTTAMTAEGQSFDLADPPAGYPTSALGLSDDGRIATGYWPFGAYRWSPPGGIATLAGSVNNFRAMEGYDISSDGGVVTGVARLSGNFNTRRAFRWSEAHGLEILPRVDGYSQAEAVAMSSDGSVIYGTGYDSIGVTSQAFRWTEETGLQRLGFLTPADYHSDIRGSSRDGRFAVGTSLSENTSSAFVWSAETGMQALAVTNWRQSAIANAVTMDGSIIVGASDGNQATIWRHGVQELVGQPGTRFRALSEDGRVIVGQGGSPIGDAAIIWTPERGVMHPADYARELGVVVPQGLQLRDCTAISADGRTIVGTAGYPGIEGQGFMMTIPAPPAFGVLVLGGLALRRRLA